MFMNRSFSIFAICLFAVSSALAQNSILWEISGNGLTQPSYLMGTLKFIGEKEYYLPPNVPALMKQCKTFAIEDEVDHHAQHELNKAIHFPKGQSLAGVLSEAEYNSLKQLFSKEFKVNSKVFEKRYAHIKPLPLSILMTRLSLGEKVKFYDIELLRLAKDLSLTTYSLESVEREAEALNKFPMEDQARALAHSVANFNQQKEEFRKLMADYPKGDLHEMFEYTLHPTENNPVFLEEFYHRRNEEWLPKMEKMMKEAPSFLAIGLSHLEGQRGLLELLRAKGYALKAIAVQ
ncbi:MAG: TraB/GumN family protein [Bacteroidota bacterium]